MVYLQWATVNIGITTFFFSQNVWIELIIESLSIKIQVFEICLIFPSRGILCLQVDQSYT